MRTFVTYIAALLGFILSPCVSCLCCYNVHASGLQDTIREQPAKKMAAHSEDDCAGKHGSSGHSDSEDYVAGGYNSASGDDCCSDCEGVARLNKLAILTGEPGKHEAASFSNHKFKKKPPEQPLDAWLALSAYRIFESDEEFQNQAKSLKFSSLKLESACSKALGIRGPPLARG